MATKLEKRLTVALDHSMVELESRKKSYESLCIKFEEQSKHIQKLQYERGRMLKQRDFILDLLTDLCAGRNHGNES
jgi:hypothetical protein